jgi:cytochrome bd-type quinol oxidase subunit 1
MLAAIRPDSWNFPLFLHVLGAMILVGGLFTGGFALALARGNERLLRLGYRSLLAIGLPGYIVMRIGAEWTADKEGFNEEGAPDPAWLGIGYVTADIGALLFLIALIVGGIGVYRLRKGGGVGLLKASMVISLVLLAAYVVAVWAMSAKPD